MVAEQQAGRGDRVAAPNRARRSSEKVADNGASPPQHPLSSLSGWDGATPGHSQRGRRPSSPLLSSSSSTLIVVSSYCVMSK